MSWQPWASQLLVPGTPSRRPLPLPPLSLLWESITPQLREPVTKVPGELGALRSEM